MIVPLQPASITHTHMNCRLRARPMRLTGCNAEAAKNLGQAMEIPQGERRQAADTPQSIGLLSTRVGIAHQARGLSSLSPRCDKTATSSS
jgi:hypothetical protein